MFTCTDRGVDPENPLMKSHRSKIEKKIYVLKDAGSNSREALSKQGGEWLEKMPRVRERDRSEPYSKMMTKG